MFFTGLQGHPLVKFFSTQRVHSTQEYTVEFTERLKALGLSKAEFGERCGVSKQAVTNWVARGLSAEGEEMLRQLEEGFVRPALEVKRLENPIELGSAVVSGGQMGRVVRIDRVEALSVEGYQWIYYVCPAYETKEGWELRGPALRNLLRDLTLVDREMVWVPRKGVLSEAAA